jgi:hypothetical protein
MKHAISARWLLNPNHAFNHFLNNFYEAHMIILFIVKVKIKWPSRSPSTLLTFAFRMIHRFWARSSSSFQHMSFWCLLLHPHPTIRHSNRIVHLRRGFKLGTPTLPLHHLKALNDIFTLRIFIRYEILCAFVGISTPHTITAIRSSTWTTYCERAFMNEEEHPL